MTIEQARLKQTQVRNAARELLDEFDIEGLLSEFGKVEFEGAYSYNLMVKRDIDILLINSRLTDKLAEELHERLIAQEFISDIKFVNENKKSRREGAPKGYYYGLRLDFGGNEWKIDVWFVADNMRGMNYPKVLRDLNWIENCTEEQKDKMLLIKSQLYDEQGDYFAAKIYQAVLQAGVSNAKEFKKWKAKQR